jgi:hypothetical protein
MIMAAAPDSCNPEPQFILSEPLKSGTADKTADKPKTADKTADKLKTADKTADKPKTADKTADK